MSQIKAGLYRYWITLTSCIRNGGRSIRTEQECNWWGTIWRCSGQAWNIGTTYEHDEQKVRGVTTVTQLRGLTKTVLLHFSNPYYPLDHMYAMPRNMPDANGIFYQVGQHRL